MFLMKRFCNPMLMKKIKSLIEMENKFFDSFLNTLRKQMIDFGFLVVNDDDDDNVFVDVDEDDVIGIIFGNAVLDDVHISIMFSKPYCIYDLVDEEDNICESVNDKNQRKIVQTIECTALIDCQFGKIEVPFCPLISPEDCTFWALEDKRYSNNFITMYQSGYDMKKYSIYCNNDLYEYANFPREIIEYLYQKKTVNRLGYKVTLWELRAEIREKLEGILRDTDLKKLYKRYN